MTSTKDAAAEYGKLRPQYEQFAARVSDLLSILLAEKSVHVHAIEHRAKTLDSFRDKLNRPGKKYDNPMEELTDLAGLRIIVYHPEVVKLVEEIVRSEFTIDEANSSDTSARLAANEFGYLSIHLVVGLSNQRKRLVEWRAHSEFRAEIQIRTVLQHAWAAISHELQYKHEDDIPETLKRKLFRLSGLLELADEEFSSIKTQHEALATEIASSNEISESQSVDIISLQHYVENLDIAKGWRESLEDIGFNWPEFPRDVSSSYSELSSFCAIAGVEQIAELDSAVRKIKSKHMAMLRRLWKASDSPWTIDEVFVTQLLLVWCFPDVFTEQKLVELGWGIEIANRVTSARTAPSRRKKSKKK